jgi:hypothetical protein
MGLGTSLLLIAVGAILRFAVSVSTHGFNLHTIGVILMIVGGVGFLISLVSIAMAGDRRPQTVPRSDVPPTMREPDPRY